MNISVCMIVRNEEAVLKRSLQSILDLVPEIIIVDTGSTDNTKGVAREFTDKVYDFIWHNDFSAARNFSLEKATKDWVLVLDADEVVTFFNSDQLQNAIDQSEDIVGRIKIINMIADSTGEKRYVERVGRLFNRKNFHYEGIIHEQIVSLSGSSFDRVPLEIVVEHIGYTAGVLKRTDKITRNIKLLELALSQTPDNPYLIYQLGKSYYMLKDFQRAVGYFKKTLVLPLNFSLEYVENLIESYGYALINSGYYSEALCLSKYVKYYSNSPDYLFLMGHIYMNNGMFTEAVESFTRCIGEKESKAEGVNSYLPNYNMGVIFECLGDNGRARMYYKLCHQYPLALNRLELLK
ncbi:glycosyltransferase [Desulfosporosinus sp. SB140]|uniref:glycosyltransferase n=1 Tax=Desulfosporosinus paludis TaxID=3115649 RepID=UPI00388DCD49